MGFLLEVIKCAKIDHDDSACVKPLGGQGREEKEEREGGWITDTKSNLHKVRSSKLFQRHTFTTIIKLKETLSHWSSFKEGTF
jgi:hypothetical protein